MLRSFVFFAAAFIAFCGVCWATELPPPPPLFAKATTSSPPFPPIWPAPATFHNGSSTLLVDGAHFKLLVNTPGGIQTRLQKSFDRFTKRTFEHLPSLCGPSPCISFVMVHVENYSAPLQLGVDESYELNITSSGCAIKSTTIFGAYHALETLSQLISFNFDTQIYEIALAPWYIQDAPRFPHRGVLVDTSRHFLPVDTLKIIIDSLSYSKFNVMHWHIVDAQSFPFDSHMYPRLGAYGAYSKSERFSSNDVRMIVSYAEDRGIRVMVELDTPGHSAAMCRGYPEICPNPACPSTNVNNWALDPTKNLTYTVINGVLWDMTTLFPEVLLHLGGDEVDYHCWEVHPAIMSWLKERNMTVTDAYEYYVKRVQKIAWGLNRQVVGWQEIWDHFGTQLDKRTVIQQWLPNSITLPKNVTSHGYRLIWSDSSRWYLDHLLVTWKQMYTAEPCNGLNDKECALVLGGEACQWGETVDTSDALQTIWPRAAAVAEKLWSPRSFTSAAGQPTNATESRLISFRCLLNQRGIAAAPVLNPIARMSPPYPGSCFQQ